jgi:hypothetical protein
MSIASPKLSPIILSTNNNGKNQTNSSPTSIKKEFNNNNTSRTSNGNDSIKSSINHKKESLPDSPSKRKIRVLHSSDESDDDDKPLAKKAAALNGQNSKTSVTIKKESTPTTDSLKYL